MTHQDRSDWIPLQRTTSDRASDRSVEASSEDIHIRNYDHQLGYDLDVEILVPGGRRVFTGRYYLQPGQTTSECDTLTSGEYELRVTLDNDRTETLHCRISSALDHTAVIEVGNGGLALTEGLQS